MPNSAATRSARARSRDAIAVTREYRPRCMAGITCRVPIPAVLRTPHRTIATACLEQHAEDVRSRDDERLVALEVAHEDRGILRRDHAREEIHRRRDVHEGKGR